MTTRTPGSTDQSVSIHMADSSTGADKTDLTYSDFTISYRRGEAGALVSVTPATLAAVTTAHTDGGMIHVSGGEYRLDLPDAAVAAGVDRAYVFASASGAVQTGGALEVDLSTQADLASIVSLIGAASITANGPTTSATTIELVEQDDYSNDDGRAIAFTGTFSGEDITGATVNLRVTDRFTGTNIIDVSDGTVVTGTGTQAVRVELSSAEVALLTKSGETYSFHCRLTHDSRKITVAQGTATVLASLFDS